MVKTLDNILPKEFVDKKKQELENGKRYIVEPEDIIEAEFLMKFGWSAYWDLHPEKNRTLGITGNEMTRLLMAGRKIDAQKMYRDAQTAFIGSASAQSKKPSQTFNSATRKIVKNAEPDNG